MNPIISVRVQVRKIVLFVNRIHITQQFVGSKTDVLLQTASGIASDNMENRKARVKIILDSGAERTYITVS